MVSASWYWQFVRIDISGGFTTEAVSLGSDFFQQQFPEFAGEATLETNEDRWVQRQLVALLTETAIDLNACLLAECALRCYISNQILRTCADLERQFGIEHGFTLNDLLGFVLNDVDLTRSLLIPSQGAYQPFAAKILRTFDPEQSSLSTWTTMLVRQQIDLNNFLLEQGVFLQSDWAILNDKEPDDLQRILANVYRLPAAEVGRACVLLKSFHLVYRKQRRQRRARGRCSPPTEEQLNAIRQKAALSYSTKEVMKQLLHIAAYLRQYYVATRVGTPPGESIDRPEVIRRIEHIQIEEGAADDEEDEQIVLLRRYRQQLIDCLDQAIEQTIDQRRKSLQRKPEKASKYLSILKSYYCEKKNMTAIAAEAGLKAQYEVTRLLQITDFLASVRQHTLKRLRESVLELTQAYIDPDRLQHLDEKIEAVLNEQLDQILAKVRANSPSPCLAESLFIQRLCSVIRRLQ